MPVVVLPARLTLYRNVPYRASIAIPFTGLALHQRALRWLSLTLLGFYAELLV
jgi:hypothetical protein